MRIFLISVFVCLLWPALIAQAPLPGLPFLRNFDKRVYPGGTQNWEITQTREGVLLVANNEGLLTFDGIGWDKYPLPNRTIVRAIKTGPDNHIFVGGQDEFGYFAPNSAGLLQYYSLIGLLPAQQVPVADVWDIAVLGKKVFFRTSNQIFLWENNRLTVLLTDDLRFMGGASGRLFCFVEKKGLLEWNGQAFLPVTGAEVLVDKLVTDLCATDSSRILICTLQHGLFELTSTGISAITTDADQRIRNLRSESVAQLYNGNLAIGTELGGVLILDGRGKFLFSVDRSRGLQNNFVTALYQDLQHNLWIGLNYGISMLEIASPYQSIFPDGALQGTAYAAAKYQNTYYFGTSNGLYLMQGGHPENTPGRLALGTESQVWGLNEMEGQLFMGHHEGSFRISGAEAVENGPVGVPGIWLHLPLRSRPGYVVAGHYSCLALFRRVPSGLELVRKLEGFTESCRFLVEDTEGILWASHPYRGIFRIALDPEMERVEVTRFGTKEGLPSALYNHVFFVHNEVVVTGERGLFRLNPESNLFEPHPDYSPLFDADERIIRLREDQKGNIWYASDKRVGRIRIEDKGLTRSASRQDFPRILGKLVSGFELIYPVNDSLTIFGMDKGFLLFEPNRSGTSSPGAWHALVSKVFFSGGRDSLLAGAWHPSQAASFPHKINDFRMEFAATDFTDPEGLCFRFRLTGLESQWSEWLPATSKEYTNLSPGNYEFQVQARNTEGQESGIARFSFSISPPWYASWGARVAYVVLFISVLFGLVLIPRRQFEKEKAEIENRHASQKAAQQQELARSKEKIDHLMREKFESEINHKSSELATATMHLVQKNEVLTHLREELEKVASKNRDHPGTEQLREIIRMLNHDQQFDADWEQFATHFDQVHEGFLRRLQEKFPQLTPKDQRLCAYLRMNLATKEIAPLMNISVRGVEISRYRLRKKLGLDSEVNLTEYMMRF